MTGARMALSPLAAMTLIPAGLAVVLVVTAVANTVPDFFDPCHEWGMEDDGSLALDEECPSRTGTSKTRGETVFAMVAIQGTLLLAAGALFVGALHPDGRWTATGATLLLALVPPFGLGFYWIPTLLLAVALFVSAAMLPRASLSTRRGGLHYAVAGFGIVLLLAFLWSDGAIPLALMVLVFGATGMAIMVFLKKGVKA